MLFGSVPRPLTGRFRVNSGLASSSQKGADSHADRESEHKLASFLADSALCLWAKQTNPQRIGGTHGVYEPIRGRDVNRPVFFWDDGKAEFP